MLLHPASTYPFILAEHPAFNSGLVAIARCLHAALHRPIHVIDVGAAVGDTVALLREALPDGIGRCLCIDGAEDNRDYLEANIGDLPGVSTTIAMLAATRGPIASLVTHSPGTAAAFGSDRVQSTTLDDLLGDTRATPWDLLKIDVDGFDGEVIAGARDLLGTQQPVVFFEWHPALAARCGNSPARAFDALVAAGYAQFVWYRNRGSISHFSGVPSANEIAEWTSFLLEKNPAGDPHFDIAALPPRWTGLRTEIAKHSTYF